MSYLKELTEMPVRVDADAELVFPLLILKRMLLQPLLRTRLDTTPHHRKRRKPFASSVPGLQELSSNTSAKALHVGFLHLKQNLPCECELRESSDP